jgi:hypothetical protein
MLIHHRGGASSSNDFMLHHMAPVTRGVSNAHQHGFIFRTGFLKGFFSPWIPIYGIVRVLKEIWRRLVDKLVREPLW